ncbi:MAG: phage scaffolding protein [Oscillospiraceae bacterium]|nr:phage scaffolding protein [Oscillospiraceae bacterium]
MNKDDLLKLGVDDSLVDKLLLYFEVELKEYMPKLQFNELNTSFEKLKEQLNERDQQLERLKASISDSKSLKAQIESLQNENKEKEVKYTEEIKKLKIENAIEKALSNAKARNIKAVKALLDLKDAKLNDDGTIQGLDTQIKALKNAPDSKFLFESSAFNLKGLTPGAAKDGISDISANPAQMTYDELCVYMESNPSVQLN